MLPPLAGTVLWYDFVTEGTFSVLSQLYKFKADWLVFIEWLSQQTGTPEAGPAMACQYYSVLTKVYTMDQVWILQLQGLPDVILHIFSGLSPC